MRIGWELTGAFLAVAAVVAALVAFAPSGFRPGGPLGLSLATGGFLLMFASESLYSLRKRVRGFHFGPMQTWLRWHVFTGIVGPALVLLHSGGKFHGLAGVLSLLTATIVVSGFVGRHVYTAIPRTLDGAEIAGVELVRRIDDASRELAAMGIDLAEIEPLLTAVPPRGAMLWAGSGWRRRRRMRELLRHLSGIEALDRPQVRRLKGLLADRLRLETQVESLSAMRRLLSLWHAFHVPLGIVLFTLAFIHIGAALYYAFLSV